MMNYAVMMPYPPWDSVHWDPPVPPAIDYMVVRNNHEAGWWRTGDVRIRKQMSLDSDIVADIWYGAIVRCDTLKSMTRLPSGEWRMKVRRVHPCSERQPEGWVTQRYRIPGSLKPWKNWQPVTLAADVTFLAACSQLPPPPMLPQIPPLPAASSSSLPAASSSASSAASLASRSATPPPPPHPCTEPTPMSLCTDDSDDPVIYQ